MAAPADAAPPRPWYKGLGWLFALLCGALTGIVLRLVFSGAPGQRYSPMLASFALLVPLLVGAVTVYVAERERRRSRTFYFFAAAGANALFIFGTLLIMIEGIICAVLAVPLFGIIGGVGGLIMGAICRRTRSPQRAMYGFAALPLLLGSIEPVLPQPMSVHFTERQRVIAATPARIWTQLVDTPRIQPEEISAAWMYRIGVPLPESAITTGGDGVHVRHIRMGRGVQFDQIAAEWEPNVRVRWIYRFAPDSFPPGSVDDHVLIGGEYFDVLDTEYTLHPVPGGTLVRVRMRYRVSTAFNWYALPIARWLVGNFEETALAFYAGRAGTSSNPG
jgi:hypothetical protein